MSYFCPLLPSETDGLSDRDSTSQQHGPGSLDWDKIFRFGHRVVESLQTLISLAGGVGAEMTNPSDRSALAVRERLMLQLNELTGLLELDRHILPCNGPSDRSGCAIPSTSLPGPHDLGINQEIWLSLLKLGRFLKDLSSRLEGGKALSSDAEGMT